MSIQSTIQESLQDVQETIQDVTVSIQDEIASKAVRKSTLKSIKEKKKARLKQLKADYENEVQEINIQYAEDPERLKAKYAAAEYARTEKARNRAERKIAIEKKVLELEKIERRLTLGEDIAASILQGIGMALFIAATAILCALGIKEDMDYKILTLTCYALFGSFMILMYLFSCLHHAIRSFTAKQVFNRLAHITAFLNIGFAYTAYSITKIQGIAGWVLFGIVWMLSLVGVIFYAIGGQKHKKLNTVLYTIAGFSGFALAKNLYMALSVKSFTMLMFAAGFYVFGIIFYNLRKIKFMTFVGNCFLLAGSIYLFFSLFFL